MDEATREYLDAVNKIAETRQPTMLPLPDEVVWLEVIKCLVSNDNMSQACTSKELAQVADTFLKLFKRRFRNDEESN